MAKTERAAISLEELNAYLRGNYFASVALKRPLAKIGPGAREALHVVDNFQKMISEYRAALEQTIKMHQAEQNQN